MSFSACLLSEVKVSFHQDFEVDFDAVNETVQDECWPMQNYWSSLGLNAFMAPAPVILPVNSTRVAW